MRLAIIFGLTAIWFSGGLAQERLPKAAPIPKDNPQTKEKILLGKALFFDPRLSKDGTVSCNSCHNVMGSGGDNRSFSAGVKGQLGGRSAPTVWNSAFLSVQFWDGRAKSLEEQAKGPLTNPVEMAMPDHAAVMNHIQKIPGYAKMFERAFGSKELPTIEHVAKAIASFERTLVTPNSRFDQYLSGKKKALSQLEVEGYKTMQTVGCFACHSGVNFAGPTLAEGNGFYMKFPTFPGSEFEKQYQLTADKGRFEQTKKPEDLQMWRVPSLRNIAITAPYFHNGSVANLNEAVRVMAKTQLNKELSAEQVTSIVAFLGALTGERPTIIAPTLPDTPNTTLIE